MESSGWFETGKEVIWKFPEFEDRFHITDIKVEANHFISFVWDPETGVTIRLEKSEANNTIVRVNEKEMNKVNLKWALENSGGCANFLACMKAYLEYGIQLRKGAFDLREKTKDFN